MAELATLVDAATANATAVSEASDAGEYATRQAAEQAIAAARTSIQAAIDAARSAYPSTGFALVTALKALAASLLDLNRDLAEALQTETITLASEHSLLAIARSRYATATDGDLVAWAERLWALNPNLVNPTRIPSGTQLVVYVSA
jgi:hypothetical protein